MASVVRRVPSPRTATPYSSAREARFHPWHAACSAPLDPLTTKESPLKSARAALQPVLFLMLAASPALAQDPATSTIAGTVTDAAGVPVAGAKVTAVRRATGHSRETTTAPSGAYTLTNLPPGEYTVTVSAAALPPVTYEHVRTEVGRLRDLPLRLVAATGKETVTVSAAPSLATGRSVVEDVIAAPAIENLPLNGRNFLELSLLVPGNAPAPNFDPTKTNSFAVSSAGQLGRSAGSSIAVVTKSGNDTFAGTASFFFRDDALQGLPATADPAGGKPSFDRQQYSVGLGGPLVKGRVWWFGAAEYRNQDAVVQVGRRDVPARTIRREFAAAPLDDVLATGRVDVRASDRDDIALRYAFEDAKDTGASTLDRAIGSDSQRQTSRNLYHLGLASWTRTVSPSVLSVARVSYSDYDNQIEPVLAGRQLTFPSIQDGASFRVPQGTAQKRFQLTEAVTVVRGAHVFKVGAEVSRTKGDFFLGVFREGRVELIQDFLEFDLNRDGRVDDDDLLFAVTLRSGKPDQDLLLKDNSSTYLAGFIQDDWRLTPRLTLNLGLRYELDTNVKNISGYGDINPIVQPFLEGERKRDGNNFGPRIGFNWTTSNQRVGIHGGYG